MIFDYLIGMIIVSDWGVTEYILDLYTTILEDSGKSDPNHREALKEHTAIQIYDALYSLLAVAEKVALRSLFCL